MGFHRLKIFWLLRFMAKRRFFAVKTRFYSILVFFRRHWWRFFIAFVFLGTVIYLIWHIPDMIIALGHAGDEQNEIQEKVESDEQKQTVSVPVIPTVYIVTPSGLYTDYGFFGLGGKIGNWSLVGLDTINGLAKWSYNDEVDYSSSVRSGLLQSSGKN